MLDEEKTEANVLAEKAVEAKKTSNKKKEKQWAFPTASKCPRCGTTDTKAIRTDVVNGWQYRLCQRAICRHRYRVQGVKV